MVRKRMQGKVAPKCGATNSLAAKASRHPILSDSAQSTSSRESTPLELHPTDTHLREGLGHVLQRRERQVQAIHVVLRKHGQPHLQGTHVGQGRGCRNNVMNCRRSSSAFGGSLALARGGSLACRQMRITAEPALICRSRHGPFSSYAFPTALLLPRLPSPHLGVAVHVALCGLQLPADEAQQRGLADAVGAHNGKARTEVESAEEGRGTC